MKVMYKIKKGLFGLLLPLFLLNGVALGVKFKQEYHSMPIESVSQHNFDFKAEIQCNICEKTGNITSIEMNFSEKNRQRTVVFEGQKCVQFVQLCQQEYPEQSLQDAFSCYVSGAIEKAKHGDVSGLRRLLNPKEMPIDSEICVLGKPFEQITRGQGDSSSSSSSETKQGVVDQLREKDKSKSASREAILLSIGAFAREISIKNSQEFHELLKDLGDIHDLQHDSVSEDRLVKGVTRFVEQATGFMNTPNIRTFLDFIFVSIYDGPQSIAESKVARLFNALKLAIINANTTIGKEYIEINPSGSGNVQEILADLLYEHVRVCAPGVLKKLHEECANVPGFRRVLAKELSISRIIINAFTKATVISCDAKLINHKHFQRLVDVYNCCKSGRVEDAKAIAHSRSPAEQELIRIYQLQLEAQKQYAATVRAKTASKTESSSSSSAAIQSKTSVKSTEQFQVNAYVADIIQSYGRNIRNITDFKSTSWEQFATHSYLVDCINKQAERVFTASNVTEQAIAMYAVDGLIRAHDLSQINRLEKLGDFLTKRTTKAADVTADFITEFLSKLTHNAAHSREYIKECVEVVGKPFEGGAKLGYFIVDASVGQLFRTPEERAAYFDGVKSTVKEACDQLRSLTAKDDAAEIAGGIMADMVFDGSLKYVFGESFIEKAPRLAVKVVNESSSSKLSDKTEKQEQVSTFSIVLNSQEISSPTIAEECDFVSTSAHKQSPDIIPAFDK